MLVIEPSVLIRRTIGGECKRLGASVELESSLFGGLRSIEATTPDAVIVARVLGGLPGESLVAALRASPLHEHLPIAILSSDGQYQSSVEAARPDRVILRDATLTASIGAFLSKAFEAPDAAESQRELRSAEQPPEQEGALLGRRVLVVDDMESMRRLLSVLLSRYGAIVTQANDGYGAVNAVFESGSTPPDLVLMDYEMPEMDGGETLAQLRGRGYTGPVLLCSGHEDPAFERRALDLGFCGVVTKAQAHRELQSRCVDVLRSARDAA